MTAAARWAIAAALLAKLVLLAALYPKNPGIVLSFDSGAYLRSAQALRQLGRFSISPSRPSEPEIVRTPGYPALIAGVFAVGGERLWVLGVMSALCIAATGLLVGGVAGRESGPAAATAAAVLFSVEPSTFHSGMLAMTEAPFVLGLALTLALGDRLFRHRHPIDAFGAGAVFGLTTLVRPVLSYAVFPVVLAIGLLLRRRADSRKAIGLAAACAIGMLAVLGPWKLRNWRRTGDASISQIRNVNLYFFDAASIVADLGHESVRDVEGRFGLAEFAYRFGFVATRSEALAGGPEVEAFPGSSRVPLVVLARFYRNRALSIIAAHPGRELEVRARGLGMLLTVPNTVSWADEYRLFDASGEFTRLWVYPRPFRAMAFLGRTHPGFVAASALFLLPALVIYVLAIRGTRRAAGSDVGILLLVLLAYLLLASTVPGYPDDRLRVPLFPILCVLAGLGWAARKSS